MSTDQNTPTCVFFNALKGFGGISNRDLAAIVLSDRPIAGGKSARDRIDDKTFLSRSIVHVAPQETISSYFADFRESSNKVLQRVKSPHGAGRTNAQIISELCSTDAAAMEESLKEQGLDSDLYSNVNERLCTAASLDEADRAYLLILLFLVTGCSQDPKRASAEVAEAIRSLIGTDLYTQATSDYEAQDEVEQRDVRLALCRMVGSHMKASPYILSTDAEGTEIGTMATAEGSITDVEQTVSRHHLLIRQGPDGYWYAHGLGSRNGTVLISGEDRSRQVIEPPRDQRQGFMQDDVRIQPGDKLELARDTVFMVIQVDLG